MRDSENFKSAHARMRFILSFDLTCRALSVWGSDVWGVLAANTRTSQSRYAFTTVTTANDSRDVIRNVCARSEGSPEWMGIDSWGLLQFRITRAYVLVRRLSDFLTAFTRYLRKLPLDFCPDKGSPCRSWKVRHGSAAGEFFLSYCSVLLLLTIVAKDWFSWISTIHKIC